MTSPPTRFSPSPAWPWSIRLAGSAIAASREVIAVAGGGVGHLRGEATDARYMTRAPCGAALLTCDVFIVPAWLTACPHPEYADSASLLLPLHPDPRDQARRNLLGLLMLACAIVSLHTN